MRLRVPSFATVAVILIAGQADAANRMVFFHVPAAGGVGKSYPEIHYLTWDNSAWKSSFVNLPAASGGGIGLRHVPLGTGAIHSDRILHYKDWNGQQRTAQVVYDPKVNFWRWKTQGGSPKGIQYTADDGSLWTASITAPEE